MSVWEALVLGIVQGLTEFLPISSTAHLRVVPALLGWDDPGVAYSAVIQLGSVLAVVTYFWRDLFGIVSGAVNSLGRKDIESKDLRLLAAICLGTLPICVAGLLLKHYIEQPDGPFRSLVTIGVASVVMGILLLVAEKASKHERTMDNLGVRDGLIVGVGQALALIPGCSRSGSTLTFAMFLNMNRADAARFSFLLGIPAIVLSGLLELKEILTAGLDDAHMVSLAVGLVASTVVSYLAIAWLLKYLQHHSTWIFIAYRLVFGGAVLFLAARQLIH